MQIEGRNAVLEALKNDVSLDIAYIAKDSREGSIRKAISLLKEKKVIVKYMDKVKLEQMTQTGNHQGIIALTADYQYAELSEVLREIEEKEKNGMLLLLDEIEDPHNLGALIRSAEGAGADAVIIPKRRAAMVNATVEKTSAGAVSHMKVVRVSNLVQTMEDLKKRNYWIYGLEMNGQPYDEAQLKGNIVIVVGNEGRGMGRLVTETCDFLLSIPMRGKIQSLNASVAGSIVLFEAAKQRG